MYIYMVKNKETGTTQLIEASSPANAIAYCAKENFTAQRVDGAVLDALKMSMAVESIKGATADQSE